MSEQDWTRYLDTDTRSDTGGGQAVAPPRMQTLTILCHGDPARVGERAWIEKQGSTALSRLEPDFVPVAGGSPRPLADPRLSRRPIRLGYRGGWFIDPRDGGIRLEVNGERVTAHRDITPAELEKGVVVLLGERVALCWHWTEPVARRPPSYGLVGESSAIVRLQRHIEKTADLDVPVLIRGESGTGKELVARAVFEHSKRRANRFVSVNMGAIPPTLAAAELFGATKGAYSGAEQRRAGYFREVDGGTLFLDEVGEAPLEVQTMLLRTLESGEIQPVGTSRPARVDVRILAATDTDLDAAVSEGRFKAPLLHRLRGFDLAISPLRRRVEDMGRLFFFFLAEALEETTGELAKLVRRSPLESSFVPARLVARLALHDWPGNVRELRNVARHIAISARGESRLQSDPWEATRSVLVRDGGEPGRDVGEAAHGKGPRAVRPSRVYRDPSNVSPEELRTTLGEHGWNLRQSAEALGISRASLYTLIARSPEFRTAATLSRREVENELAKHANDLDKVSQHLQVSKQGLKRRIRELGLLE